MLKNILSLNKYSFGFKDMKKAFFQFLNLQAGAVYRGAPQFRQRKYQNVEISQEFKKMQAKRKQQRLIFVQKRKKLLEAKLSNESKLLTEYETTQLQKINEQSKSLKQVIEEQNSQLKELDKKLQQTQADYILVERMDKLIFLNEIIYLRHMNTHPSGMVLTPQAVKVIENVHYLITHNLPVQRYKLYQIMPGLFVREIGQLQQSVQRLIQQKHLNMFEQTTSYSIRQFTRLSKKLRNPKHYQIYQLKQQRRVLHANMSIEACQLMTKHKEYIDNVIGGRTVFRNIRHCTTVLASGKLKLKLTPEEEEFKKDILTIFDNLKKWQSYAKDNDERILQIMYSYVEPPVWIKNHPRLAEQYDKWMENYTNPINKLDAPNYLPDLPHNDDGRAFMEERLRKQVEKFDEEFTRLFNEDREQLMAKKKQTQIQFYNISTRILEEYQALQDKSAPEEVFQKLPKKQKKKQEKYVRITMDELVKAIYLNNQDRTKYNLDFFARYFGMQENKKELFEAFNSLSYLRILVPQEQGQGKKQISQQVLKFMV